MLAQLVNIALNSVERAINKFRKHDRNLVIAFNRDHNFLITIEIIDINRSLNFNQNIGHLNIDFIDVGP